MRGLSEFLIFTARCCAGVPMIRSITIPVIRSHMLPCCRKRLYLTIPTAVCAGIVFFTILITRGRLGFAGSRGNAVRTCFRYITADSTLLLMLTAAGIRPVGGSVTCKINLLIAGIVSALMPMAACIRRPDRYRRMGVFRRCRRFLPARSNYTRIILTEIALLRHGGRHQTDHHDQCQQKCRQLFLPKSSHCCSLHETPEITVSYIAIQWWMVT